jgi:hypothetical protein
MNTVTHLYSRFSASMELKYLSTSCSDEETVAMITFIEDEVDRHVQNGGAENKSAGFPIKQVATRLPSNCHAHIRHI